MRAIKKVVVTAGFGGLAAAAVAGSGAFACTPQAAVEVTKAGGTQLLATVRPGQVVDIHVEKFFSEAQLNTPVRVSWQDPAGASTQLAAEVGPNFVLRNFMVPADATPSATAPFNVVAKQLNKDGVPMGSKSVEVFVWGDAPVPPGSRLALAATEMRPAAAPVAAATPVARPATSGAAAPQASTPAPAPAPVAAPAAPAATQAPAAEQAATVAPVLPVTVERIDLADLQPQVAPSDLWSGLSAGNGTASLVDAAAPAQSGTLPLGAILLGSGVIALAGVALATSRRRLAFGRINR